MHVTDLTLKPEFKDLIAKEGIDKLYPPQKQAVDAGVMNGENILLCTPTASGKTLTAQLAIMSSLTKDGSCLYIAPLKALAQEKYVEFKQLETLGYKVTLEVGDLDSSHVREKKFDVMVATPEKCDSILRSSPRHFNKLSTIIFDEIHLIHSNRGPVYEVLAARFRKLNPQVQILGLSATIGNAPELAGWLSAKLVKSEWRPVQLAEEVEVRKTKTLENLSKKSITEGGQILIFVNSRKSAESVAEKLGKNLKLPGNEKASEKILDALSTPTTQCKRLAGCVKNGTAFHHAGLVYSQRVTVEEEFKKGNIKVIAATPTLAAGVNLPSRTVIIRDVKRYGAGGMNYIPILEYKQQVGRAGRPKYDDYGIAITMARDDKEAEFISQHYIHGQPEDIHSQLGIHPVLRFHTLSSIASGFTRSRQDVIDFFQSTFFGYQYGGQADLKILVDEVMDELEDWEFITQQDLLKATMVGHRVSQLYIDPLTAHTYIEKLATGVHTPIGLLEVLCDAVEVQKLNIKRGEEAVLWGKAHEVKDQFSIDIDGFDLDYLFLDRFKTALLFYDWVCEKTEEEILEKYNVSPGQLYQQLNNMEWLIYAAQELAKLEKLKAHPHLVKLGIQVKYGVYEDLLQLVSVKNIGRARARKLYNAGVKTIEDLKTTPLPRLSAIIGAKTAEKIRRQLA